MTAIPPPETPEQHLQRILYETMQLVAHGQVDEARPGIDELARLLPNGPAIEYLRRAVVVVNLQRQAVREPLVLEAAAAPDPASIDLVAFHADLAHPQTDAHPRIDYGPLLCLFFEAARIRAPHARSILLTDEHTRLPDGLGADQVLRFPIDLTRLMYERMRVQTAYLEGREAGRASVLLDSDVVVNREPSIIFGERFDLGLTWRRELPDAPFNGGVILAAAGSAAVAFFKTARACYDEIAAEPSIATAFSQDLRAWWGDQFAIAATVGYRAFRERSSEGLVVDGVRVRFLPCEDYNFTMEPRRTYDRQFIAAKRFVHFKGNRKALQHEYLAAMKAGQV